MLALAAIHKVTAYGWSAWHKYSFISRQPFEICPSMSEKWLHSHLKYYIYWSDSLAFTHTGRRQMLAGLLARLASLRLDKVTNAEKNSI